MITVTVTAERGKGVWVLESDNGAVSQVRTLAAVDDEMREAVAYLAGVSEDQVALELHVVTPASYDRAMREAERLRVEAERANADSAAALRRAATSLVSAGVSYRDAARVMGVSYQRVAQLV
ncbi:hypothetical protein KJZ00_06440 [Cutibacterium avidum]|uniref:hypothetical protein n=1 Tax=Cutibacterium avidum TaxID=33010 RepID=UPI000796B649|nr:hypothetical protein [Cutibacterium avidum]KXA68022.1 toxin-antitoxin system, antitoxin component, HicB family [Cutibacterium avidum]MCO6631942.1 hypothetical protein [Cutibacterium avidum]MCO6660398.1 hypothetical protein [Cutibacterium avidum]MCO6664250.1 hypothetical protein [Cutibacterium avidum]MCO6678937.1 hypothetical protein [Cutibacterium avidum]